jgi:hypothetical protein
MSAVEPTPTGPRILSLSRDPVILSTRNLVLKSAGYEVASPPPEEAVKVFIREQVSLVVLGGSIDVDQRQQLAVKLHSLKPTVPIVDVYRAGEESPVGEADAHVGSLDGPEALLTAADKLIHR